PVELACKLLDRTVHHFIRRHHGIGVDHHHAKFLQRIVAGRRPIESINPIRVPGGGGGGGGPQGSTTRRASPPTTEPPHPPGGRWEGVGGGGGGGAPQKRWCGPRSAGRKRRAGAAARGCRIGARAVHNPPRAPPTSRRRSRPACGRGRKGYW